MLSTKSTTAWAEIDEEGRLILPAELISKFGLKAGAKVRLDEGENFIRMHRPISQLTKVYIEPTVECNLDCITCFRKNWEQPLGRMSDETFEHIFSQLQSLDPIPDVYFGGIGEPLYHPKTIEWIGRVKQLGVKVEVITNGTTLTERKSKELIATGVDLVWVSLDGASEETFADVRLGAELSKIIANMKRFAKLRKGGHFPRPEIGVAFVAMKRNIDDLPEVIRIGKSFRAKHFSVSNIQPATEDMLDERLYDRVIRDIAYLDGPNVPRLKLPKMDLNETTYKALFGAFTSQVNINLAGNNWGHSSDTCSFVEAGTLSIAWNGDVSPCWPLMHTHTTYLHSKPKISYKHVIGNVSEKPLWNLWMDEEYVTYRRKLHEFAFAPCTFCGGCDLSETNEEDCIGNEFPSCGGCLWAQGVIQCP